MSIEDKAQELEAAEWEIRNMMRPISRTFRPEEPGYGPAECEQCEDQMPAVRRGYGFKLCTTCAERAEKSARLR
jgi:RNA polymerase-binding transcription factor DksA